MSSKKVFVIAIAAVSGGGKTFITNKLNDIVDDSKALYFDHYDYDEPESICEWVKQGSNYNVWNLDSLVRDIEMILCDNKTEFLFLDYPFAKKHDQVTKFIDLTIFIDTPLDIALSRRLLRDFNDSSIENMRTELESYLSKSRFAYLDMLKRIKPNSDIIIDGSLESDVIIDKISIELIGLKSTFYNKSSDTASLMSLR